MGHAATHRDDEQDPTGQPLRKPQPTNREQNMTIQIIVYITTENDIVDEEQVDQDLRDAVSQAVKDVIAPSLTGHNHRRAHHIITTGPKGPPTNGE